MYVLVCWKHLQKARKCKSCIDYYEEKNQCRHPAPYQNAKNEKGPRWALMGRDEYCGQWKPKFAIELEKIRDEELEESS